MDKIHIQANQKGKAGRDLEGQLNISMLSLRHICPIGP